jgi:hypothetical protein
MVVTEKRFISFAAPESPGAGKAERRESIETAR